jgi:hypothetical protein
LIGVTAEADLMVYRGGSPLGEFWKLSVQQLRDGMASAGRETRALDEAIPLYDDTAMWFQGPLTMAAWGQRA